MRSSAVTLSHMRLQANRKTSVLRRQPHSPRLGSARVVAAPSSHDADDLGGSAGGPPLGAAGPLDDALRLLQEALRDHLDAMEALHGGFGGGVLQSRRESRPRPPVAPHPPRPLTWKSVRSCTVLENSDSSVPRSFASPSLLTSSTGSTSLTVRSARTPPIWW